MLAWMVGACVAEMVVDVLVHVQVDLLHVRRHARTVDVPRDAHTLDGHASLDMTRHASLDMTPTCLNTTPPAA